LINTFLESPMNFASLRVITNDVERLVRFYEAALGLTATRYTEDFAEISTPSCTLAIGSTRTVQTLGAGAPEPAGNRSAILEFHVADVDAEYVRLRGMIGEFVQAPTTQPWGNRSLLFRDPDGALINLFTPMSPEAVKKYEAQTNRP
jgi:predicted enzyme related to lactoylglutathione lyase